MRFWTIITMRAMTPKERFYRLRDWAAMTVALKLPLRVRYWVTLLEIGKATKNSLNVPATPLDDVVKNLDAPKVVR